MNLGVLDHAIDFILGQARTILNLDGVFLAGALVLRGDVDDAISVDVEGDLDLRNTTGSRSDTGQLEGAEQLVGSSHLALALEDLDLNAGLVVLSGGEGLRTLGRNGGVAFDQLGHHATLGLNTKRQRGDVEQEHVLDLATQHTSLEGSTDRNNLIRVNALIGLLATGKFLHQFGDCRHTGGTTDEHNVVDVANTNAGILDDLVERSLAAVQQILGDALELSTGQGLVQEQRVLFCIHSDVGQVDVCGLVRGQLDLCLLSSLTQTLQSHLVLGQVDAVGCLELLNQPVNDALIPVIATKLVIAGGCANLDHAITDLQEGDVEGTATKVEDQDGLFLVPLLKAVSQCSCGGLVNDTQDVETRDLASLLGCLTLGVREVSRDSNDGVSDVLTQVGFSVALELHQSAGRNFLRGVVLAVDVDSPVLADVALHGADGAVNVGDCLVLSGLADKNLAVLSESNHRGGGARAFSVGNNDGLAAFKYRYNRVSGSEVDAYCTSHNDSPY